jgi:ribose 1,5-bisphosphate isomerase
LFQGRITAKNLSKAGLDVTMITDSSVASVMKDIDIVIVGADVITAQGQLVNKVGTSTIATIAQEYQTSFYSAAELWKYDPMTKAGISRKIEERDPMELLSDIGKKDINEFEKVKIRNLAFDVTEGKYINSFVTEKGLVSPQDISTIAEKALKEMLK